MHTQNNVCILGNAGECITSLLQNNPQPHVEEYEDNSKGL